MWRTYWTQDYKGRYPGDDWSRNGVRQRWHLAEKRQDECRDCNEQLCL
jgi:hypothetical protein